MKKNSMLFAVCCSVALVASVLSTKAEDFKPNYCELDKEGNVIVENNCIPPIVTLEGGEFMD